MLPVPSIMTLTPTYLSSLPSTNTVAACNRAQVQHLGSASCVFKVGRATEGAPVKTRKVKVTKLERLKQLCKSKWKQLKRTLLGLKDWAQGVVGSLSKTAIFLSLKYQWNKLLLVDRIILGLLFVGGYLLEHILFRYAVETLIGLPPILFVVIFACCNFLLTFLLLRSCIACWQLIQRYRSSQASATT